MKLTTKIVYAVCILSVLSVWVMLRQSEPAEKIPVEAEKQLGQPTATPTDSFAAPSAGPAESLQGTELAQSVEDNDPEHSSVWDTGAIMRMDDSEWEELRLKHGLTIDLSRDYISSVIPVRVDIDQFEAARHEDMDELQLDLGLDEPVVLEVQHRVQHQHNAYTLAGAIRGEKPGEFSLSVYDDVAVATFNSLDFGSKQLRYVGLDVYRVDSIDHSKVPACPVGQTNAPTDHRHASKAQADQGHSHANCEHGCSANETPSYSSVFNLDSEAVAAAAEASSSGDATVYFDILIAYTPAAVLEQGSEAAMIALINQGVTDTNLAFQTGGLDLELRLVGTVEVDYSGQASGVALEALTETTDGAMDEVHELRDTLGADFVALWTPLSDACGVAWLPFTVSTTQDYLAFSVTDPQCQFQYTFTHELGHNLGCMHAVGDSGPRGEGLFDYSHGWRFDGNNNTEYRTVLAYAPGVRIRQYSDPNVFYQGVATGVEGSEDNIRTIEEVMDVMSQYRISAFDDHGNSIDTATLVQVPSIVDGELEVGGDEDFFKLNLNSPGALLVYSSGELNTFGSLLDSDGDNIATNDNGGIGNNFKITETLAAGTYYVRVRALSQSVTGTYTVHFEFEAEVDDHGNTFATSTSVTVGSLSEPTLVDGEFEKEGDIDVFKLNLNGPSQNAPGTLAVGSTGSTDMYAELYDSEFNLIASDDNAGDGFNFFIQRAGTLSGTYYLRLNEDGDDATGPYVLSVGFDAYVPVDSAAELPVYEDFEDELGDYWYITGTGTSRITRTTDYDPYRGEYHLVMDASEAGNPSRNELTLALDLVGKTDVEIRFQAREFMDDSLLIPLPRFKPYAGGIDFDGVAISENGTDWYVVFEFPKEFAENEEFYIDLDTEALNRGLTYNSTFQVRFNQFDNYYVPVDGIVFDNIEVTSAEDRLATGELSVAAPTGDAVAHQDTVDIGEVRIPSEEPAWLPVTISNTGSGLLTDISTALSNLEDFSFTALDGARLFPGESAEFTIGFLPQAAGESTGTLSISSSDTSSPFELELEGTGVIGYTLMTWRQFYFGSPENMGDGADYADPNKDGVVNLAAFATGQHPLEPGVFFLDLQKADNTSMKARYKRSLDAVADGIIFTVEWTEDLAGDVWDGNGITEEVIETVDGVETVEVTVPSGSKEKLFVRLTISK